MPHTFRAKPFPSPSMPAETAQVEAMTCSVHHHRTEINRSSQGYDQVIHVSRQEAEQLVGALWAMGLEIVPAAMPKQYTSQANAGATKDFLERTSIQGVALADDADAIRNRRAFKAECDRIDQEHQTFKRRMAKLGA